MNIQGSEAWFRDRMGKITASRFYAVMEGSIAKKNRLLADLQEERKQTDIVVIQSTAPPLQWGIKNEPRAIAVYEMRYGVEVERTGFIQHPDHELIGGSPDFLLSDGGGEIKCPYNESIHLITLQQGMPTQHVAQVQGNIWINDREWFDFISFDPRRNTPDDLFVQRIYRDKKYIEILEDRLLEFIDHLTNGTFYEEKSSISSIPQFF